MTAPTAYVTAAVAKAAVEGLNDFTDTQVEACVSEFESIFERYRGFSAIPRTVSEEVGNRPLGSSLFLAWPLVTTLTSITCDSTAISIADVVLIKERGEIHNILTWPGPPVHSVLVAYTHGLAAVPPMVERMTIEYVNRTLRAQDMGTGRDVLSEGFDGGATRYVTPDWNKGRPTGWLEVDRLLNSQPDRRRPQVGAG